MEEKRSIIKLQQEQIILREEIKEIEEQKMKNKEREKNIFEELQTLKIMIQQTMQNMQNLNDNVKRKEKEKDQIRQELKILKESHLKKMEELIKKEKEEFRIRKEVEKEDEGKNYYLKNSSQNKKDNKFKKLKFKLNFGSKKKSMIDFKIERKSGNYSHEKELKTIQGPNSSNLTIYNKLEKDGNKKKIFKGISLNFIEKIRHCNNDEFPGAELKDGKFRFYCHYCEYWFSRRFTYVRHLKRKSCRKHKIFYVRKILGNCDSKHQKK